MCLDCTFMTGLWKPAEAGGSLETLSFFLDGKRWRFPGEASLVWEWGLLSPLQGGEISPPSTHEGCVQVGGQAPRHGVILWGVRGSAARDKWRAPSWKSLEKDGPTHQICPSFHFNEKNALPVASDVTWLSFFLFLMSSEGNRDPPVFHLGLCFL